MQKRQQHSSLSPLGSLADIDVCLCACVDRVCSQSQWTISTMQYFDAKSKRHWNACRRESTWNGRQTEKHAERNTTKECTTDDDDDDDDENSAEAVPFDRSARTHPFDSVHERQGSLTHTHASRTLAHVQCIQQTYTGDLSLIIHLALYLNLVFSCIFISLDVHSLDLPFFPVAFDCDQSRARVLTLALHNVSRVK